MQLIDSIETYAYQTTRDLVSEKEEIKCNNKVKDTKMIKFDDVTKENTKKHNPSWIQVLDHPYRILLTRGSGLRKTNSLFNLISHQPDIDKIYLHAKDPYEAKYPLLINKRESTSLMHFNDPKEFIESRMIWIIFIKLLKNAIQT